MRRVSVGGLGRSHGSPGVAPARLQARAEGGSRGLARDLLPCEYVRPEARMCATMTIRVDNARGRRRQDRKSTRLNSSHVAISYAVFCLKKKKAANTAIHPRPQRQTKQAQQTSAV